MIIDAPQMKFADYLKRQGLGRVSVNSYTSRVRHFLTSCHGLKPEVVLAEYIEKAPRSYHAAARHYCDYLNWIDHRVSVIDCSPGAREPEIITEVVKPEDADYIKGGLFDGVRNEIHKLLQDYVRRHDKISDEQIQNLRQELNKTRLQVTSAAGERDRLKDQVKTLTADLESKKEAIKELVNTNRQHSSNSFVQAEALAHYQAFIGWLDELIQFDRSTLDMSGTAAARDANMAKYMQAISKAFEQNDNVNIESLVAQYKTLANRFETAYNNQSAELEELKKANRLLESKVIWLETLTLNCKDLVAEDATKARIFAVRGDIRRTLQHMRVI